jgi:hypothetical protein
VLVRSAQTRFSKLGENMAGNDKAIRDLSRRFDVMEDLLHVLARTWPGPPYRTITGQGETTASNTFAPGPCARVSVDGSMNDSSGVLKDAHDICKGASNICQCPNKSDYRDLCTKDAFANLRGGKGGFSLIVGHGRPGWINTGSGDCATADKATHMSPDNVNDWKSYASQGFDGDHLVLFGCNIAAGVRGAAFLQQVAKYTKKDVGAWTGAPSVCDGNLRGSGEFVIAHPTGRRLKPVNCPELYDGRREIVALRLRTPDGDQSVPVRSIRSLNFTPIGNDPETPSAFTLQRRQADRLLKLIDFGNPVAMPGKLLAIRTGQLTILFQSKKGPQIRAFYFLGYWLLQDAWFLNTYYHASHRLERVLRQFSRI